MYGERVLKCITAIAAATQVPSSTTMHMHIPRWRLRTPRDRSFSIARSNSRLESSPTESVRPVDVEAERPCHRVLSTNARALRTHTRCCGSIHTNIGHHHIYIGKLRRKVYIAISVWSCAKILPHCVCVCVWFVDMGAARTKAARQRHPSSSRSAHMTARRTLSRPSRRRAPLYHPTRSVANASRASSRLTIAVNCAARTSTSLLQIMSPSLASSHQRLPCARPSLLDSRSR